MSDSPLRLRGHECHAHPNLRARVSLTGAKMLPRARNPFLPRQFGTRPRARHAARTTTGPDEGLAHSGDRGMGKHSVPHSAILR